ncbi:hypothetical protein B0J17DRAFT_681692 [Rhizoctonia solani]|nr:hypothetical protein B0J17DRAFT_681692 [Rhizoctonia solani]
MDDPKVSVVLRVQEATKYPPRPMKLSDPDGTGRSASRCGRCADKCYVPLKDPNSRHGYKHVHFYQCWTLGFLGVLQV